MEPTLVQACMPADFDSSTYTCLHPVWVSYQPSPIPVLSVEQSVLVSVAIIACWCLGAGFRALYRTVQ